VDAIATGGPMGEFLDRLTSGLARKAALLEEQRS
jgi:hypothetical protein